MVKKKKKGKLGITSLLFSSSSSSGSSCTGGNRGGGILRYSSSSSCSMSSSSSSSAWQWPSCKQPRTISFRQQQQETMMKTMNSAYSADGCFSNDSFASLDSLSSSSTCRRTASDVVVIVDGEASDKVVNRALRSDRLFFDPDASPAAADVSSSSVLNKLNKADVKKKKKAQEGTAAFGGATAMSIESSNPYRDFRSSMEAMVKSHAHAHGGGKVDDWRWLEKMLGWYLRANAKSTHGLVVGAFVDLLVSAASSTSSSPSPAAKCPSCCSACSSLKEE